ncbi:ferredoxin [Sphingobium sp. LB126]|uniref:2Fe-2S iron-sulfur cluster-binding protein n=1 Tax=Sphingobium sp. LB126 TaxID=1983755 RepID=UPI000C1FE4CF|nr:2Fe-2S iron-sulfur cluster-binding protein [Sphingobium sp. LB126]PJG47369.1 ferredoxin [Sphingobium sp. LB126]
MPKFIITGRDGEVCTVDVTSDGSVMEMIRDSGGADLAAICGGNCACATCHVHIDPAFAHLFEPMADDENELLSTSAHRTEYSRLSCQLRLSGDVEALALRIAEED